VSFSVSRKWLPGLLRRNVRVAVLMCICFLVVCGSLVSLPCAALTTSKDIPRRLTRDWSMLAARMQGPDLDYSNFKHNSHRHASLACTSCHTRNDNSATPRFPGHKACTDCHLSQFVTPNVPMCTICHADVNSANPPLKGFPTRFNERFNVKFDHTQHNTGSARPDTGCVSCHRTVRRRAAALSIPSGLSAHNQCYTCHTPGSQSSSGREIASCGVCHEQRSYSRTPTNARAYSYAFSHAKHGRGQRLDCGDCHRLTAGLPQSRQVSSPLAAEHFAAFRRMTCLTCHNGKRSFGGDLAFKDCRRCHGAATFRMPM
jgi:hypothetical protein